MIIRLSLIVFASFFSLLAAAADIPTVEEEDQTFDQTMCVKDTANNCINTMCLTSEAMDCQDQCHKMAADKCNVSEDTTID